MIDITYIKENKLLLYEVISGSRAYGLATETSDTDIKGVFYLPKDLFYGMAYIPQLSNETNDIVYYELGRFIELLCRNNPNILEMLATPEDSVLFRHPLMDSIRPEVFLSLLARDTFAGYAFTQVQKARGLNKKMNHPQPAERKTIVDFSYVLEAGRSVPVREWLDINGKLQEHCGLSKLDHTRDMYALYYDALADYKGIGADDSNEVHSSRIAKGATVCAYLFCNQEAYSLHCKNYREYWEWVQKRNDQRFRNNQEHGKGYDAKNMMHTIRLLQVALELLQTAELRVRRPNREELLSIKQGLYEYEALLGMAEALMQKINEASVTSSLPELPDEIKATQILINIRKHLYDTTD